MSKFPISTQYKGRPFWGRVWLFGSNPPERSTLYMDRVKYGGWPTVTQICKSPHSLIVDRGLYCTFLWSGFLLDDFLASSGPSHEQQGRRSWVGSAEVRAWRVSLVASCSPSSSILTLWAVVECLVAFSPNPCGSIASPWSPGISLLIGDAPCIQVRRSQR